MLVLLVGGYNYIIKISIVISQPSKVGRDLRPYRLAEILHLYIAGQLLKAGWGNHAFKRVNLDRGPVGYLSCSWWLILHLTHSI